MKLTNASSLGTTLVLIAALSACKGTQAPEAASTTASPATEVAAAPAAAEPATVTEAESPPMAIPGTADGIWEAIDQHSAELKATIASGSLGEVHLHAFAIRDLVAALPSHSPVLPADDQAKLQGEIKFVNTLADRLDKSGDAGDKAASQANYDQLVTVLSAITRTK